MRDFSVRFQRLLALEYAKSAVKEILPGPEVKGDPFWVLVEVDDEGTSKAIYHSVMYEGKQVVPIYENRQDAVNVLRQAGLKDMAVRGVSRGHMRVLVEFQKEGFIQLGVCVLVRDDGKFGIICPTAEAMKLLLEHMGRWHDEI